MVLEKIKSYINQSVRVWHLLKKPDSEEFTTISKISAIGLGLIGVMGFIINLVMTYFGLS